MTTTVTPGTTAAPIADAREQEQRFNWIRVLLVIVGVAVLFAATYLLAWWDAGRLTNRYVADANASYAAGDYLDALTGYQEFDEAADEYVQRGGYLQVERIWQHRNAWPIPDAYADARTRIDEIIAEHLTVADAEQFVQQNIGRVNPYLGPVYLRLGELYEAEGDTRAARDVYAEVADLFSNQPALAERAQANLERLNAQ